MATFAELFCAHYQIPLERFAGALLRRGLHRRAWILLPLLPLLKSQYLVPDYEFIRDIGQLRSLRELPDAIADFRSHPANLRFARRRLYLRMSTRRVSRLVRHIMGAQATDIRSADTQRAG